MNLLRKAARSLRDTISLPVINSLHGIKRSVTLTKKCVVPSSMQAFRMDLSPVGMFAPPETLYLIDCDTKVHEVKRLVIASQDSQLLSFNVKCEICVADPHQALLVPDKVELWFNERFIPIVDATVRRVDKNDVVPHLHWIAEEIGREARDTFRPFGLHISTIEMAVDEAPAPSTASVLLAQALGTIPPARATVEADADEADGMYAVPREAADNVPSDHKLQALLQQAVDHDPTLLCALLEHAARRSGDLRQVLHTSLSGTEVKQGENANTATATTTGDVMSAIRHALTGAGARANEQGPQ